MAAWYVKWNGVESVVSMDSISLFFHCFDLLHCDGFGNETQHVTQQQAVTG